MSSISKIIKVKWEFLMHYKATTIEYIVYKLNELFLFEYFKSPLY